MVVDLNRCVGCQTCTIACKHANDTLPQVQWRRVLDVETGRFPDVERLFLVVGCQHCAEPPCVPVCPTGATFQREDGLVAMSYDLCIGCGYCAVACPYQARTIVHDQNWYYGARTTQEEKVEHPERLGVAQKCTFCVERIDAAATSGQAPGVDFDVTPACASSCIAQAIRFGDFSDTGSEVSQLLENNASFQMHAELGTDPQIKYLYETPAIPGRDADEHDDEALDDPHNPLVGARQTFWDLRAATNFVLGGFGSGLAVMTWIVHALGALPDWLLPRMFLVAGLIMGVGLAAVFLEIGRKARFLRALRRPQSSWMTREVYAVAVFFPAMFLDLLSPHAYLHSLVALAALAFLYCQARILQAGRGIPAWRVPLMPWMLVATGLLEGTALLTILALLWEPVLAGATIAVFGIMLAAVNAALWYQYRTTAEQQGIQPLARAVLEKLTPWLHLSGHVGPLVFFTLALTVESNTGVWLALAGIGALAGGAMWKVTVITRACHQQGFRLNRLPYRGSGARAAG
jgi:phenylacetyl-CoA:acceptor oxidoreductase subunit 1